MIFGYFVIGKELFLIYRNSQDLKMTAEKLHDGENFLNPPVKVALPTSLEEDKGVVSRVKCINNRCAFARDASDVDLVTFETEGQGSGLSLKIAAQKTFLMYKGFNLDSIEMSEDYIVASGCQMYDTINFSIE